MSKDLPSNQGSDANSPHPTSEQASHQQDPGHERHWNITTSPVHSVDADPGRDKNQDLTARFPVDSPQDFPIPDQSVIARGGLKSEIAPQRPLGGDESRHPIFIISEDLSVVASPSGLQPGAGSSVEVKYGSLLVTLGGSATLHEQQIKGELSLTEQGPPHRDSPSQPHEQRIVTSLPGLDPNSHPLTDAEMGLGLLDPRDPLNQLLDRIEHRHQQHSRDPVDQLFQNGHREPHQ